jgi:anti-sigma factor RsiW
MTNSTMTCEAFDAALPDHLEGTLDGSLRSAVEGHLRECVRCASLVRDLRNLETEATQLPDLVPSRDLWQGIEARIAAPVIPLARPERVRRFAPTWMGIAAAALIVSTAGITYTLTARSFRSSNPKAALTTAAAPAATTAQANPDESSNPDESANPEIVAAGNTSAVTPSPAASSPRAASNRAAAGIQTGSIARLVTNQQSQAVYAREIEMLQNIVSQRKTQLDSSTITIIERNLLIIDRAIEQSKAALASDPASRLLSDQLTHALDKKVELLRTAAMLPANT